MHENHEIQTFNTPPDRLHTVKYGVWFAETVISEGGVHQLSPVLALADVQHAGLVHLQAVVAHHSTRRLKRRCFILTIHVLTGPAAIVVRCAHTVLQCGQPQRLGGNAAQAAVAAARVVMVVMLMVVLVLFGGKAATAVVGHHAIVIPAYIPHPRHAQAAHTFHRNQLSKR